MYKRDIVMIFPDINGKCIYHMGISYIIAYLREKGYKADIYIDDGSLNCDRLVDNILEMDPIFIGFSIYDTNYYLVNTLAEKIKKKSSKKRIVIGGGPTATFSGKNVQNLAHILIFVYGMKVRKQHMKL